jgi:hypothetical protein
MDERKIRISLTGKESTASRKIAVAAVLLLSASMLGMGLFMSIRNAMNSSFLDRCADGAYDATVPTQLVDGNFYASYVPWYNLGSVKYMEGNYSAAALAYEEALKYLDSGNHDDCSARINCALSICYQIDYDSLDTDEGKAAAIQLLSEARDILLQHGCATDEETGHDPDAQKLKDEIDELLKHLQENSGDGGDNGDDEDQKDGDGSDGSDGNGGRDPLQDKLDQQRSDAQRQYNEDSRKQQESGSSQDDDSGSAGGSGGGSEHDGGDGGGNGESGGGDGSSNTGTEQGDDQGENGDQGENSDEGQGGGRSGGGSGSGSGGSNGSNGGNGNGNSNGNGNGGGQPEKKTVKNW